MTRSFFTERGASFGYNTLVSDMRALPKLRRQNIQWFSMQRTRYSNLAGRVRLAAVQREFVPVLARAAISVGVAAVFIETHDNPDVAPSDGPNMVSLDALEGLLSTLKSFDEIAKQIPLRSKLGSHLGLHLRF